MEGLIIGGFLVVFIAYKLIENHEQLQRDIEMMRQYDANEFRGRDD